MEASTEFDAHELTDSNMDSHPFPTLSKVTPCSVGNWLGVQHVSTTTQIIICASNVTCSEAKYRPGPTM